MTPRPGEHVYHSRRNRDGTVTKRPMTPIQFATTRPARIEDIAPPWTAGPHGRRPSLRS